MPGAAFASIAQWCAPGALICHFMDWRHTDHVHAAARGVHASTLSLCIWGRGNGGQGSFCRGEHALSNVFKSGKDPNVINAQLGRNGRYRTNVWRHLRVNAFGKARDADLAPGLAHRSGTERLVFHHSTELVMLQCENVGAVLCSSFTLKLHCSS
jgi:hypothetical protein